MALDIFQNLFGLLTTSTPNKDESSNHIVNNEFKFSLENIFNNKFLEYSKPGESPDKNRIESSSTTENLENKEFFHFEKEIKDNDITYQYGYFINNRNIKLICQEWVPLNPKGLLIITHGYGDHGHGTLADDCKQFAEMGYASFIFDQEGFGHSDGLPGFIKDFDDLVDDSSIYIEEISKRFKGLKRFVYACSMGGGIALKLSLDKPQLFDGLILVAPMIKLSDSMVPAPMVIKLLTGISLICPSLAIVPGENVLDRSIKDPKKRDEHANHPLTYKGRARLATGLAILKVTDYLQNHLDQVSVPLLILHGSLDCVTSPEVSQKLYERAKSSDKTIKIYDGMWHSLLCEFESQIVYNDIINWMSSKCK